jgi:hypothetical protein
MLIQLDERVLAYNSAMEFLRGVRRRGRDLRPVWPEVVREIQKNEALVFYNEGAVEGEPRWEELSNNPIRFHGGMSYAAWKAQNYPGRKIMEKTGKLRRQVVGITPGALIRQYRRKLVYAINYPEYADDDGVDNRPRSPRDRLTGDQAGILDSGRPGRPYDENWLGGQHPMEPRTIFRIMQNAADRMAQKIAGYLTDTRR